MGSQGPTDRRSFVKSLFGLPLLAFAPALLSDASKAPKKAEGHLYSKADSERFIQLYCTTTCASASGTISAWYVDPSAGTRIKPIDVRVIA